MPGSAKFPKVKMLAVGSPLDNQDKRHILLLVVRRKGLLCRTSRLISSKARSDMLILRTLALEPMHGYGIAIRIEQMSAGVFLRNAGLLLSAFSGCNERG
jgi:hypothetical protein